MSNDYSPDMWVKFGDALNFMNGDTDFLKKDEMTDVLGVKFGLLPLLILIVGMLAFLTLLLLKFCSSFCCDISCRPKIHPHEDMDVIQDRINKQLKRLSILYYLVCFVIILAAQIIVLQRENLMDGSRGMQTFVDEMTVMFANLATAASSLDASSQIIASNIDDVSDLCVNSLNSATLVTSASAFDDQIGPTRLSFTSIDMYLDKGLDNESYLHAFIWGSYGLMLLFTAILCYCNYRRSKIGVKVFSLLAGLAYVSTLLFGVTFLCVTMVVANMCMDPYQKLLDASPESIADNLEYYFTCEGTNVLFEQCDVAQAQIAALTTSIATIKATNSICSSNTHLLNVETNLAAASGYIDDAAAAIPCATVKDLLSTFISESLCKQMYRFSAGIWASFQSASLFILILVIIGTINSQYYEADDRRKIAANVMDLEGIIPTDHVDDDTAVEHYESRGKASSSSWGRSKGGSKNESKRVDDDSDDDLY